MTQEPFKDEPGGSTAGEQENPQSVPRAHSRTRMPIFVGLAAGGILAVAFTVAILRPGDAGRSPEGPAGSAGTPSPAGPGESARAENPEFGPVSPRGQVAGDPLELTWRISPDFDRYEAIIIDTRAIPVWRSGIIEGNQVVIPPYNMKNIVRGPTYTWYVEGYRPDGTMVQSPSVIFTLAKLESPFP